MSAWLAAGIAFALGGAGWTLAEYGLHRFVFHGASATRLGAREHRQHHADPDYFAPWWQKGLAALGVTAVMLPASMAVAGGLAGGAFTVGFVAIYGLYEVLHRTAHTRPPRGAYGRWRRRNHFAHHFREPKRAHGVTVPLWDLVFGTGLPLARVAVPRRLAMRWLVDASGALRPEYAGDYELVGSAQRGADAKARDAAAAMANRRPEPGAPSGRAADTPVRRSA